MDKDNPANTVDFGNGLMLALEITMKIWKKFQKEFPESAVDVSDSSKSWDRLKLLYAVADYLDDKIRVCDVVNISAIDSPENPINETPSVRETDEYYWLRKPIKDALDSLYPFPEMSLEFLLRMDAFKAILASTTNTEHNARGKGDKLLREKCKIFCESLGLPAYNGISKKGTHVITNIKNRNKRIIEFWLDYIPLQEVLDRELEKRANVIFGLTDSLSIYRKFLHGNEAEKRAAATLIPAFVNSK